MQLYHQFYLRIVTIKGLNGRDKRMAENGINGDSTGQTNSNGSNVKRESMSDEYLKNGLGTATGLFAQVGSKLARPLSTGNIFNVQNTLTASGSTLPQQGNIFGKTTQQMQQSEPKDQTQTQSISSEQENESQVMHTNESSINHNRLKPLKQLFDSTPANKESNFGSMMSPIQFQPHTSSKMTKRLLIHFNRL